MEDRKGICSRSVSPIRRTKALQQYWGFHTPETPMMHPEEMRGCVTQIKNELEELEELIAVVESVEHATEHHSKELSDVCIDLLEYVQQLAVRSGISNRIEEDSHKIYLNNCTKTCKTLGEAIETVDMYEEQGVDTYVDWVADYNHYVVKDVKTNHVKKPKGFVPVKL